jgi:8-hydroxy-5-deazaflavin:NADPH oxidoreductase
LKGARVVKAFNTLPAAILAKVPAESGGRRVLFVSGNGDAANAQVASLIERLGFAPIVLGKVAEGGRLQQFGGPLATQNFIKTE